MACVGGRGRGTWAFWPLSRLELHLWSLGVSIELCNFLVYFLPLSVPLWFQEQ